MPVFTLTAGSTYTVRGTQSNRVSDSSRAISVYTHDAMHHDCGGARGHPECAARIRTCITALQRSTFSSAVIFIQPDVRRLRSDAIAAAAQVHGTFRISAALRAGQSWSHPQVSRQLSALDSTDVSSAAVNAALVGVSCTLAAAADAVAARPASLAHAASASLPAGTAASHVVFALVRPPGHHAGCGSSAHGFCIFNNAAIAAVALSEALANGAAQRSPSCVIVDIDAHYGEGTAAILRDARRRHDEPSPNLPAHLALEPLRARRPLQPSRSAAHARAHLARCALLSVHRHDAGAFFPYCGGVRPRPQADARHPIFHPHPPHIGAGDGTPPCGNREVLPQPCSLFDAAVPRCVCGGRVEGVSTDVHVRSLLRQRTARGSGWGDTPVEVEPPSAMAAGRPSMDTPHVSRYARSRSHSVVKSAVLRPPASICVPFSAQHVVLRGGAFGSDLALPVVQTATDPTRRSPEHLPEPLVGVCRECRAIYRATPTAAPQPVSPASPTDPLAPDGSRDVSLFTSHMSSPPATPTATRLDTSPLGDLEALVALAAVTVPTLREIRPASMVVSAGFDAARGDKVGGCSMSPDAYRAIFRVIARVGVPTVVVLEGGYSQTALADCVTASVAGVLQTANAAPSAVVAERGEALDATGLGADVTATAPILSGSADDAFAIAALDALNAAVTAARNAAPARVGWCCASVAESVRAARLDGLRLVEADAVLEAVMRAGSCI